MSDPCAPIQQAIDNLQQQRDRLQATLEGLDPGDPREFNLRRQIKSIADQLFQERLLLNDCRNKAGVLPGTSNLVLAFTERTQTIQDFSIPYYNYPVIGSLPSNNSIPMIEGKQTLLRFYPDARAYYKNQPIPTNVTGTITLHVPGGPVVLQPLNAPVAAMQVNNIDQFSINQTLNFLVPPAYCKGNLIYDVHIQDPEDISQYFDVQQSILFNVVPVVKLHIVYIHYTGLNFNDQPVDLVAMPADVLTCIDEIMHLYPISDLIIDGCETLEWDKQLKWSDNWGDLIDAVKDLRDNAGSNAIYLGLVPVGADCGGVCGKGDIGGGVCVFFAGAGSTPIEDLIHEMGHAMGRKHAPECLSPGDDGDQDYPQYGVFPRASIGGVGIDLRNMDLKNPASTRDYMSYCHGTWTSLYGYMFLYNLLRTGKFSDVFLPDGVGVLQQYSLVVFGINDTSGELNLKRGSQLSGKVLPERTSPGRHIHANIYNEDHRLMLKTAAREIGDGEQQEPESLYELVYADMPGMHHIDLLRDGRVLHSMGIAGQTPKIRIVALAFREQGNEKYVKLQWEGNAPENLCPSLCYTVRYSTDGYKWTSLLASTKNTTMIVSLANLAGGTKCRFQVMASAGLRTAVANSELFEVPCSPRIVYMLSPAPGSVYAPGDLIRLAASAYSASYGNAANEDIYWSSLKKGFLGTGQQLNMVTDSPGKDWVEVQIADGKGNLLSQKVEIIIGDRPIEKPNPTARPAKPCGCP